MNTNDLMTNERGAALVTGLVMLLIVSLLGFAAIRSNTQELRIANNLEVKDASFQQAQAALDYLLAHPELMPVQGLQDYTFCSTNLTSGARPCGKPWIHCDEAAIVLPSPMNTDNALQITRGGMGGGLPPRRFTTSGRLFKTVYFEARSCYDGTSSGGAATDLMAGIMRVIRAD